MARLFPFPDPFPGICVPLARDSTLFCLSACYGILCRSWPQPDRDCYSATAAFTNSTIQYGTDYTHIICSAIWQDNVPWQRSSITGADEHWKHKWPWKTKAPFLYLLILLYHTARGLFTQLRLAVFECFILALISSHSDSIAVSPLPIRQTWLTIISAAPPPPLPLLSFLPSTFYCTLPISLKISLLNKRKVWGVS